jgi:hypothetical protein
LEKHPAGRIANPTIGQVGGAPQGATILVPPFVLGAKSLMRLKGIAGIISYFHIIDQPVTAASVRWEQIGINWVQQSKVVKGLKKATNPVVPMISKAGNIPIKWFDSIQDHFNQVDGVHGFPSSYVIRANAAVPAPCPARELDQPYTTEHGAISGDYINRTSHSHGL